MTTSRTAVDLRSAADLDVAVRIGAAWRDLRRGGANTVVRDYFFGNEPGAIDSGQMDTLDVMVRQPSWRMSDLAEALRVDPSTATRAVQRLLKENLAEHLRTLSEDIQAVNLVDLREFTELNITETGGKTISAFRISDGVLRYLALLAVLCDPDPPPLICIEEPELGLHPDIIPTIAKLCSCRHDDPRRLTLLLRHGAPQALNLEQKRHRAVAWSSRVRRSDSLHPNCARGPGRM